MRRQGLTWMLNPADYAHESLYWLGCKDSWDLQQLIGLTAPGQIVLDIGSNFGYHALHLSRVVGPTGQVHALEPNPENHARLCRNVALNHLESVIAAHRIGVTDCCGPARLAESPGNSGHTALCAEGTINVDLTTIDQFFEAEKLERVDVIVLDVEGLEAKALAAARNTLQRFRPFVMVELFPPVMERQNSSPEAVANLLADAGYQLFAARRQRLVPLKTLPSGDLRVNAFALHSSRIPLGR